MQTLLQRLQELNEIVASGPVVLKKLDAMLRSTRTPAETLLILQNIHFQVSRQAPRDNNRRNSQRFEFTDIRSVSNGRSFV